jgi:hypothetical protein
MRSWPFLNFAGFIFIAYVGRKKNEMVAWNFELPTWFITKCSHFNVSNKARSILTDFKGCTTAS